MGRRWAAAKAAMPRDAGSIAGSPRRSLQPQRVGGRDKLCDKVGRQERVGQRGEGGGASTRGRLGKPQAGARTGAEHSRKAALLGGPVGATVGGAWCVGPRRHENTHP